MNQFVTSPPRVWLVLVAFGTAGSELDRAATDEEREEEGKKMKETETKQVVGGADEEEAERVALGLKRLHSDDPKPIFMWQVNEEVEKQEDGIIRF